MNRSVEMPFSEDIHKAPETETVCDCFQVTKADILNAEKEGARTLAEIKEKR